MKRKMAIDYGKARVGIALSDPLCKIAFPFKVIDAKKGNILQEISEIVSEFDVSDIYIGNPILLSGEEGALSREVQQFAQDLRNNLAVQVRIHLVDERLTTKIAERLVRNGGHKPTLEKGKVDMASAAVILQGVLNSGESKEGKVDVEDK